MIIAERAAEASHLPLNVSELGEHERPVEGQLCHVVAVDARRQDLNTEGETGTHGGGGSV